MVIEPSVAWLLAPRINQSIAPRFLPPDVKMLIDWVQVSAGEPLLKEQRNEYNLWQHRIRDESDFCTHVNYIHFNPVKHGLVKEVIDWPFLILVASNQDLPKIAGRHVYEMNQIFVLM
ncbi:hypothetical protein [Legionella feeleii]|uniref:Transposase and inactivated derivatives n=1 Tax=Legionella feeleii TaxID=453 RepID=A0A0W0TZZ8_9GAMM|nr:hypothetical protein Lfee_1155 [Legionella feeleii]SPX60522.1 Transposase and inactivated derivatives [Legionella feeleii]